MNKNLIKLISILILASLLLTGCSAGVGSKSWPGLTAGQDMVYVSYNQGVFAVRTADGGLAWRYPEKAESTRTFFAPPAVADNQIIVGDYANTLHNLNQATGSANWKFTQAKGHFSAAANVTDGVILASSMDRHVYALDLLGNTLWSFEAKEGFVGRPESDGTSAFIPSMDHSVYALDLKSGKQLWATDVGGSIFTGIALHESGVLFTGTLANEIVAIQAEDGKILWRFAAQKAVWSTPVLHENTLYFGDLSGSVYALDVLTGKQLWKVDEVGTAIVASGALLDDGLIYAAEDGSVVKLSFSGEKVWTRTINGKLYSTPGIAGERIVIAITEGDSLLQAFDLNGNQVWSFVVPK